MVRLLDRIVEVEKLHNLKGHYVSREPLKHLFEFGGEVTKVFVNYGINSIDDVYAIKNVLALKICDALLDLDDRLLDTPFYK